ncbi:glycoside hydrolase family 15 protein [Devosia sp.]|uniref:glycoside hydrolase family 15 protein n=1 Tax=Devosia sp. TaxID=1871048 RepID=UPI003A8DAF37
MHQPIESYAVIGDCETAALVAKDGSIDWLCWPRFDSESTFAAILGDADNGRWQIAPADGSSASARRYEENTLILETDFETADGAVRIRDFMPLRGKNSDVVRIVHGLRGKVKMRMELVIRFGYGTVVPWVRRLDDESGEALLAVGGPDMVVLHTPVKTHGVDSRTVAEFEVSEGDEVPFVLTYGASYEDTPEAIDVAAALEETRSYWVDWTDGADLAKACGAELGKDAAEAVIRSLITLKALTHAPTGGVVAAATTSLPEQIGGARNWDYRFCWLRDATITLVALMSSGHYDEARAWRDWLLRAVAGSPEQIQIMYGIGGERRLTEWEVDWLSGYEDSKPVRVGNAAHGQLQLDVYGEVMDALYQARRGGLPENDAAWALQRELIRQLEADWQQKDEGIWEVRNERRHFTYSKIMCWVAVDRCIRSVEEFGLEGPVDEWRKLRDEIHADVCDKAFDKDQNSFTQSYGDPALDASLLLIPSLGFLPADDPRFVGTVAAIEKGLIVDGFVHRYQTSKEADGLKGHEGTFLACSFWLADAYALMGREDDARAQFARLLAIRNDLGLMAEEYDPAEQRQLGNFPQAFSHVAMVHTALNLARMNKADNRAPAASKEASA